MIAFGGSKMLNAHNQILIHLRPTVEMDDQGRKHIFHNNIFVKKGKEPG